VNIVERAKSVCLSPDSAWTAIAGERAETAALITGYVLPLAGAAAVAQVIGMSLVGTSLGTLGTLRVPLGTALGTGLVSLALAAVMVVVISIVIDALAPTFKAEKNREQALKVAVYSATPVWLAGVLQIVPVLGVIGLIGALYALYLLYLGLPKLMKCPADTTVGYTGAVIACALVIGLASAALVARI
jgi:uncharacterized membrane protein